MSRSQPTLTSCWLWAHDVERRGYGQISYKNKTFMAHRVMYENTYGPIPEKLTIDHLCEVTTCVNPEHLEVVTMGENNKRSSVISTINSLKTHCSNGHEFNKENTYLYKGKWRQCRICTTKRLRKAYQERKLKEKI